ncbi:MAG: tetratricopeptide repeat protein, partial [Sedimenticola sp.]|nr:tetratricopeptide repeat protein [Sedimenticola sp.]
IKTDNNPSDLDVANTYFDSWYEYTRLMYLLGLAYELNGDTQLAVDTYYQLWQEAPESGYALLAREKLVKKP